MMLLRASLVVLGFAAFDGPAGPNGPSGVPGTASVGLPSTSCSEGDVLRWNGTAWVCAPDQVANASDDIDGVGTSSASGLLGGGAGPVTLRLLDCTDGEVLHWNGASWVCAADALVPDLPIVSAGFVDINNNTPSSGAGAMRATTNDAAGYALSVNNTLAGPAIRTTSDSGVGTGGMSVRDLGGVESGVTFQTTNATTRVSVSGTFGASVGELAVSVGAARPLRARADDLVTVQKLALGPAATFSGSTGAFVIGVTPTASYTPSCQTVCVTRHGFGSCVGTWIVGQAPLTTCNTAITSGVGMCFCGS